MGNHALRGGGYGGVTRGAGGGAVCRDVEGRAGLKDPMYQAGRAFDEGYVSKRRDGDVVNGGAATLGSPVTGKNPSGLGILQWGITPRIPWRTDDRTFES